MPKQPFTSTGVADKLTELYALSDSQLETQANDARSDFQTWMTDNFTLTTLQADSLSNLDARFVEYVSFQVYFALSNRLSVAVNKTGTESTGKLIHAAGNVSCDFSSSGFSAAGTFSIDITYS